MYNNNSDIAIECCGLCKYYKNALYSKKELVHALEKVSFTVAPGNIVGVIGPNGAGKTTLIRTLIGIYRPTSGFSKIFGQSPRTKFKQKIGYVPENPSFLHTYSGQMVLRYHGALLQMSSKDINLRTEMILEELDLTHAKDRMCGTYSQGMKQRLALGIAIMNGPEVLFLDEVSNGLDPIGVIMIRELLQQMSERGTTIMLSSHRLSELEKLTNQFIYLHKGKTVSLNTNILKQQRTLKIGIESNSISMTTVQDCKLINSSKNELIFGIVKENSIPGLIASLVNDGFHIKHVLQDNADIETIFVQLFNESNGECSIGN